LPPKTLKNLPLFARKERQILKLNLDGFKKEISHQLNISEKTVSNSLSISRKKVKSLVFFME
jgi:DNA-binding NarL/FixJ family response regulator